MSARIRAEDFAAVKRAITPLENLERWGFLDGPLTRSGPDAHRIVYIGELTPNGGVAEFLSSAIAWAEANADVPVEIMWLGEGDLLGILQAQPVPCNLSQTFEPTPSPNILVEKLARCGLLALPGFTDLRTCWIGEAMAAGLPVLGSIRETRVRSLVVRDESGFLFDPRSSAEVVAALDAALNSTPAQLDGMRAAARARIRKAHSEMTAEKARRSTREPFTHSLAGNAPA
jgi:glycosyltransferase involved in cell wall biosynthesis